VRDCALLLMMAGALLAAGGAGGGTSTAADPRGDVLPCTGECSAYDQDFRSVTVTDQSGVITFTIQQYGAFTMPAVCHCYWPQVHIYLTEAGPPSLPDFCTSFSAQLGPYPYPIGLFSGPCQITRPGGFGSLVRRLEPTVVDATTIKYAFPASAIGNPNSFRWRVVQFGSPSPVDWVPDSGTVTHTLGGGVEAPVVGGPAPNLPAGKVKVPGSKAFVTVTAGQALPAGTIVDVSGGKGIQLTDPTGKTAVFYGERDAVPSMFVITRAGRVVELRLTGGTFSACPKRSALAAGKEKPVRRLWGKGKGSFRTRGRYASAAIRGTWWLTADYCNRTLVSVKQGAVTVRDFAKKKALVVPAGKSYSALAPRKK
jgi:hypothetical protein